MLMNAYFSLDGVINWIEIGEEPVKENIWKDEPRVMETTMLCNPVTVDKSFSPSLVSISF